MTAALLNHLWQSTVCVGAVWLLTLALRANAARVRYWLWFSASLKFLIPFELLIRLGPHLIPAPHAATAIAPASTTLAAAGAAVLLAGQIAAPFQFAEPMLVVPPHHLALTNILLCIWMSGFALVVFVWSSRWLHLRALLRSAQPAGLAAPVPVLVCRSDFEPGLVGIWNPVLLLPQSITERLTRSEIDAVIAHEVCHLRRRDNLLAALHMLVAAAVWFHPLIWWVGTRLVEERERACDEGVLAAGVDSHAYAECLLKVCRLCLQSPLACAAGVSGSDLMQRVRTLTNGNAVLPLTHAKRLGLIAAGFSGLVAPLAFGTLPAAIGGAVSAAPEARSAQAPPPDRYVGYYRLSGDKIEHIFRSGDHYQAQLTGEIALELDPITAMTFSLKNMPIPMQIVFTQDSSGYVSGLTVHGPGVAGFAPRISASAAQLAEAAVHAHILAGRPAPGSQAFIRHFIDLLERGDTMDYSEMTPYLGGMIRSQLGLLQQIVRKEGAFESLRFIAVTQNGLDAYEATFEHGRLDLRCASSSSDGKEYALGLNYAP
ncbi:MAG TPA: M56 family metallopeptidase [Steroidobacteraceae bacterium]|nr:M56 family metallopeptidase [Steroidobacteraceae bacterium]